MKKIRAVGLDELDAEFRDIADRASGLMGGVDGDVAMRRANERSWSAAECIEHLNLSADPYFPRWEQAIPQATRRVAGEDSPYRMDFWGRVLAWSLEPPPRFRFPTSRPFLPVAVRDPEETLQRFLERQKLVRMTIGSCKGLAIDRVKIVSPFARSVRYSVWSSFCVTAAHERRHLWQAARALAP